MTSDPWARMNARIEAMPSGPDRTQALVDMNSMLTAYRDALRESAPPSDPAATPVFCAADCGCAGGQYAAACGFEPTCGRCAAPPSDAAAPLLVAWPWHAQMLEVEEDPT